MTTSEKFIDATQRQMLPLPGFTPATEEFWFAAGRGELVVQQCDSCKAHRSPINAACYNCMSTDWHWAKVSGTGTVYSFTWADFPPPPDGDRNISVIELDGTEGPDAVRLLGWVSDIERDNLVCDLPVEVSFERVDDEVSVPVWKPRS